MIRLPEIKTAELSTYGNFAKCHQALFRVPREGLGTRLLYRYVQGKSRITSYLRSSTVLATYLLELSTLHMRQLRGKINLNL